MADEVPQVFPSGTPTSAILEQGGAKGLEEYIKYNPKSTRRVQDEMRGVSVLGNQAGEVPPVFRSGTPTSAILQQGGAQGLEEYMSHNPQSARRIQDEMRGVSLLGIQAASSSAESIQPGAPPGAAYMKNGVWLNKDGVEVKCDEKDIEELAAEHDEEMEAMRRELHKGVAAVAALHYDDSPAKEHQMLESMKCDQVGVLGTQDPQPKAAPCAAPQASPTAEMPLAIAPNGTPIDEDTIASWLAESGGRRMRQNASEYAKLIHADGGDHLLALRVLQVVDLKNLGLKGIEARVAHAAIQKRVMQEQKSIFETAVAYAYTLFA